MVWGGGLVLGVLHVMSPAELVRSLICINTTTQNGLWKVFDQHQNGSFGRYPQTAQFVGVAAEFPGTSRNVGKRPLKVNTTLLHINPRHYWECHICHIMQYTPETKQRAVAAVSRFPPRRMRNLRLEAPKCHRVNTTLSQSGSMPIEQVRFFSRYLFFLDPRLENAHQTICHTTKKLLLLSE